MSQMTTGRALPRRTFLRGMGTAVALPFLDAMTPGFAAASTPITRVAVVYTDNGVIMQDWTPAQDGVGFAFTKTLQPVAPFRDQLLVVSGLAHRNGEALGFWESECQALQTGDVIVEIVPTVTGEQKGDGSD